VEPDSLAGQNALHALGLGIVVAGVLVLIGLTAKRAGAKYGDKAGLIIGAAAFVVLVLNAQFNWIRI
jgi:hypothetical protein